MQGPQILSGDQFLLTTLLVKLAVMAALATMLVRYRRFRHILIFERRRWPDRLIFALSLGIPLTAGVGVARLLLNYNAADLTLEGSFLAGLIAGPYAGAVDQPTLLTELLYNKRYSLLFEGAQHGLAEFREEADRMMRDWLDRYVKERKPWPSLEPHGP